jgi:FHS family L-fucose permease-like MFS transporter
MARNRFLVRLIFLVFFVISLLTNILGPIVPDIISTFSVSLGAAGFLVFAFFIAYGVMSIPAGFLVERYSEKPVMICAFIGASLGSIAFALHPTYKVAFLSLFVIGVGMAMLQVAINPLLRVAGGEEHFALNETIAQLLFGSAAFLGPWIYSYLVIHLPRPQSRTHPLLRVLSRITPPRLPWVSLYWIFAAVAVTMVIVLSVSRFPSVQHKAEERPGTITIYKGLLRRRLVWLYFLAIFAYVGCEQGSANWISQFLSHYHGYDPHTTGARAVSWFWGLMTAGCFAGALLLRIFDSRRVLKVAAIGALLMLSLGLYAPASVSLFAFPLVGLFASVMWPILISLALNSVAEHHGSFTGVLTTGIMGGAIIAGLIGRIGDHLGLRTAMALLYLTFGYVLSVGFWAKPLINNATIGTKGNDAAAAA